MHVCGFVGNHYVTGRGGLGGVTKFRVLVLILRSHVFLKLHDKKCPIPLSLTKSYQFLIIHIALHAHFIIFHRRCVSILRAF